MTLTPGPATLLQAVRSYYRNPRLTWSEEQRQWGLTAARIRLKRLGLTEMYDDSPRQTYAPDWADLLNIYTLVMRRKPKVIVEFGSGCSTLMFASALAELAARGAIVGHLYSVETQSGFRQITESRLPRRLIAFVTFVDSDIQFGEIGGKQVMWHSNIPPVQPNMVYLDGPDYQDFSADVKTQADGVLLESNAGADFAVLIDGRTDTFRFTRDNLRRRYRVTENRTHHWELLEAVK